MTHPKFLKYNQPVLPSIQGGGGELEARSCEVSDWAVKHASYQTFQKQIKTVLKAVGCWVSLRFRRHRAIREFHMPFKFPIFFREVSFNPTYVLMRDRRVGKDFYQDLLSHSFSIRLIGHCSLS